MSNEYEILKLYQKGNPESTLDLGHLSTLCNFLSNSQTFCQHISFTSQSPHPCEFTVNYSKLVENTEHSYELQSILSLLHHKPDYFIQLFKATIHSILASNLPEVSNAPIEVYIQKYDIFTPLQNIRSTLINKFVEITGTVIKLSSIRYQLLSSKFECQICHTENLVTFSDGKFSFPKYCNGHECSNIKYFKLLKNSGISIELRRISLKEQEQNLLGAPFTIECEARNIDITEIAVGDPVTVMGVVRPEWVDQSRQRGMCGLFIEIISITPSKNEECKLLQLTQTDLETIESISKSPQVFYKILSCFCRQIYGLEKVKAGLLLALFGGNDEEGSGNSHVLIVGYPGLGKTEMIKSALAYSTRGIYASNKTSLTIQLQKENGQKSMKGGALLMADEGVCAVDEFDKLGNEKESMLKAMELESVTLAKNGIYCTLKANTTVISAANTANNTSDAKKTIAENMKVNSALLSRFDLIFLLQNSQVPEISREVIEANLGVKRNFQEAFPYTEKEEIFYSERATEEYIEDEKFTEYIRRMIMNEKANFSLDFIKKYISYAKVTVKPRLSSGATELIKLFYISLKNDPESQHLIVTAREIESLKRLTQARAKADLREIANEFDAIEVIKLFEETVFDEKTENFAFPERNKKKITEKCLGTLSKAKEEVAFIERLEEEESRTFSYEDLIKISRELGLRVGDFNAFVEKLNYNSIILKRPGGVYKLQGYSWV